MGRPSAGAAEVAKVAQTGTLSGTTPSAAVLLNGDWNIFLSGTWTGTVTPQVSRDAGTTWVGIMAAGGASVVQFSVNGQVRVQIIEDGINFRLLPNLSAGSVAFTISQ